MVLPNFLIIGAHKGGTTWLSQVLREHPDVWIADREIKFFTKPSLFAKGLDWYKQQFEEASEASLIGEKSPKCLFVNQERFSQTHRHIHESLPEAKLIAVLRNPVQRAISHARHCVRDLSPKKPISPFVSLDKLILDSYLSDSIIEGGFYARQLESYYEYFKPDQILVIINEEEIVKDPKSLMKKVCSFLEIDSDVSFEDIYTKKHEGALSRAAVILMYLLPSIRRPIHKVDKHTLGQIFSLSVKSETIEKLHTIYQEENERLFKLLGYRWSSWSIAE